MGATPSRSILVAVNQPVRQLVSYALQSSDWNLIFCDSVEEAKQLLDQRCNLILCSLQFDSSRLFDLLRYAKANPQTRPIPFIVLKVAEGVLSESAVKAGMKAAKLSGADDCANLADWRKQLGDEPAYEKLRHTIRQLLMNRSA